MKPLSRTCTLIALFILSVSACKPAQDETIHEQPPTPADRPPLAFLAGSYEVVGRYPDSERIYTGTVSIDIDEETGALAITRTIGDASVAGTGTIATAVERTPVLRIRFEEAGQQLEATYLIDTDLDNYARLSGYVYAQGGGTTLPGIETLFADHYRQP